MKKLLIATIEFPPQKGGVANYLAGLAGALPKEKVIVLAPHHRGENNFDRRQQYKIYRKKLLFKVFWPKWLLLIWQLWHTVRREKVEAFLVGQILPVGTAAMIVKKFLGTPYFISCHGMDIMTAGGSPRKKKLMKKILTHSTGIVVNSEFTKRELLKLGVLENKIVIIYPCLEKKDGIEIEKLSEIKNRLGLADKKVILTVGRLVKRKGHDKVIEAMPEILKCLPQAIYVVVGDGPEKERLQVLSSKLKVQDNVLFMGEVSEEKKNAFYQLCDVFVMTPRQIGADVEGFGIVYLEANQYGKPVVASWSGGVAEAVVDGVTGIVVDPENKYQIAEAIIKLLTDENLAQKFGKQGKERVEKEFQWEIQTEKLNKLIN